MGIGEEEEGDRIGKDSILSKNGSVLQKNTDYIHWIKTYNAKTNKQTNKLKSPSNHHPKSICTDRGAYVPNVNKFWVLTH